MWTSGFFNSKNGDRVYTAEQLSHLFTGLITNGVYESVGNKLAVRANEGMTIEIRSGRGWFNGQWVNNDAPYLLTLEASDQTLNRYCAVCIKVDHTDSGRSATPYLKYSTFATTPSKPIPTRSETVNEYILAYVYIAAKATEIYSGNIEDTRFNTDLCGWVTGLITQLDTQTLYTQWQGLFNGFLTESTDTFTDWFESKQDEFDSFLSTSSDTFNEWFQGLVDIIDEDVETRLVAALPQNALVTIPAEDWDDETKGASVSVVGMTTTKSVIVKSDDNNYNTCGVTCIGQSLNQLDFSCDIVPTEDVEVNITFWGE